MTVDTLEQGQKLLETIEEYEKRIKCVENGDITVDWNGRVVWLNEDIFREIISAQLKKDLNFLKERFESL